MLDVQLRILPMLYAMHFSFARTTAKQKNALTNLVKNQPSVWCCTKRIH